MYEDFSWEIAWAAQAACILEADAPKVGNVNRRRDFSDCCLEDFHLSALAIGKPLGQVKKQGIGQTVHRAIRATRQAVPSNTNLGIVLLLAPLAMAWSRITENIGAKNANISRRALWASGIAQVLHTLTTEDTRLVYEAVRLAAPSGMGSLENHDVYREYNPEITLLEAMRLAADQDLIARQYITDFQVVLGVAVSAVEGALNDGLPLPEATAHVHLFLLSQYPDSLITRKAGSDLSRKVQARAQTVWEKGGWLTDTGQAGAAEFDAWLREDGNRLNPGSTADLMAAALFVLFLENGPELWKKNRRSSQEITNESSARR